MLSYLVSAVVLFLITVTIVIFLRLSLLSIGILVVALAGSIGTAVYGYYCLSFLGPEDALPGAVLLSGGVGSLAICSISASLIFSKKRKD